MANTREQQEKLELNLSPEAAKWSLRKEKLEEMGVRPATHENIRPASERRTAKPRHPLVAFLLRIRRWPLKPRRWLSERS